MSKRTPMYLILAGLLVLAAVLLSSCQAAATETAAPAPVAIPTCPAPAPCPVVEAPPPGPTVPYEEMWAASPHNDAASEAFVHWDDTEDKAVPAGCATCHSSTGYVDFLGADGSEAGKVDAAAPIGTTVDCVACHNLATATLTDVTFPSGLVVSDAGDSARCLVCHQGRASKTTVDAQIEKFAATDLDAVVAPIKEGDADVRFGFINIHYYAAAATLYGTEVKGGYEYEGKTYDAKFDHIEGYATCAECHNSHTLEVKLDQCAFCHEDVAAVEDLKNIRMVSSAADYDGDGDSVEGLAGEISGMQEALYQGLLAYAKEVVGTGIIYDSATYPYFLTDADGDGAIDKNAEGGNVAYTTWTPRLLKAAYNYQVSLKDPGNYAHGNKYVIQLLFDSLEDLNSQLSTPIDMAAMHREDAGHFAGNSEAFRHWDAEGEVPGSCARCHSATGLPQFVKEGVNIANEPSNGFSCYTCHDHANWPGLLSVASVPFPSGAKLAFAEGDPNNLCLECHQGRAFSGTIDRAVTGLDVDTPSETLRFSNVHYFAAGATLFGSDAKGIYQYEGQEYAAQYAHAPNFNTCTSCHDPHALAPKTAACAGCHQTDDPATIRMTSTADYDGDGDVTEGVKGELEGMAEKLYAAIQAKAVETSVGTVYDSHAYPYFFVDADGDGEADKNADGAAIGYNAWTPRLLKAAYNYQYYQKDPGAFAHNFKYVAQALYDSIVDLGGDVTGMTRP